MLVFQGWGWYACALKVSADLAGNTTKKTARTWACDLSRNQNIRYHQLLTTQKNCSCCGVSMRERPSEDISDKTSTWCPQYKTRKSIRDGGFFAKSRLTLQKWLLILYMWVREYHVTDVAEVDPNTAVDIFQWLREVCTTCLLQTKIILGTNKPGQKN